MADGRQDGAARIALATGRPLIPVAQWEHVTSSAPTKRVPPVASQDHACGAGAGGFIRPAGRPFDHATLDIATDRIVQAITELLEGIRDQKAPVERYSPAKARWQEREATDALDEEDQ